MSAIEVGPVIESTKGRFVLSDQVEFIDVYVSRFFYFQEQVKIFHWNAADYGKHKALDGLYDELLEASDKFVESYIGIYDKKPSAVKSTEILTNGNAEKFLSDMRYEVGGWRHDPEVANTALDNILQDLEAHIANAIYLYRLK